MVELDDCNILQLKHLWGVWEQSIIEVLRQNHGIEEYHGIFSKEMFG
jgi:hypothetical protein